MIRIIHKYLGLMLAVVGVFLGGLFFYADVANARENVSDWYIQDFTSRIMVNTDSTLDISETIVADCGNAVGKHGIFRILPISIMIDGARVSMPVELVSITDQNGRLLRYEQSEDYDTVTWKIGNPNTTVQGVNIYKINYRVKNIIRFGNPQFDELYWNLNGNFWDLQVDHFRAEIIFPAEVNEQNTTIDYYTGALGSKSKDLATYRWQTPNILAFESTKMLNVRQGITASIIFPKNIFTPYQPTFWERYGEYFFLLIPLAILILCFWLWSKYGKDPQMDKTIIAEYEVPDKLSPTEVGMLMKSGAFDNKLITAEIIYLATRGLLTITETHNKFFFFDSKDYELTKKNNPAAEQALNMVQNKILKYIFTSGAKTKKLSSLKNSFYERVPNIKESAEKLLRDKKLVIFAGLYLKRAFQVIVVIMFVAAFYSIFFSVVLSLTFFVVMIVIWIFSFLMPKRTPAGAELNWKVEGFKLFMETVDKDRAVFYEKENIFEKCLPYAIVFGMTKEWAKRMQDIYGQEFYTSYAPVWYVGNIGNFDVNSISDTINSLASSIASSISAPSSSGGSGSGGFGGAGGGGGGGGGGGW